jgi:restriction system protein
MAQAWMVRSGKGGIRVDDFLAKRVVAIGWSELNADLTERSYEDILRLVQTVYPSYHPSAAANAAAMLHKFVSVMASGDRVVTYDSERRIYHLGTIAGTYQYQPDHVQGLPHVRSVTWSREVGRDSLTQVTRNSLGSTLTLFRIPDAAKADLEREHHEPVRVPASLADEGEVEDESVDDTAERSLELIKDMILGLDADKMEELLASVLRAMGYKAGHAEGPGSRRGRAGLAGWAPARAATHQRRSEAPPANADGLAGHPQLHRGVATWRQRHLPQHGRFHQGGSV